MIWIQSDHRFGCVWVWGTVDYTDKTGFTTRLGVDRESYEESPFSFILIVLNRLSGALTRQNLETQ